MADIAELLERAQAGIPDDWVGQYYPARDGRENPAVIQVRNEDASGKYTTFGVVYDKVNQTMVLIDYVQLSALFDQNEHIEATASPNIVVRLQGKEWRWFDKKGQSQRADEDDYTYVRASVETGEIVPDDETMVNRNAGGGDFQQMAVPTAEISGETVSAEGLAADIKKYNANLVDIRRNISTAPLEVVQEGNEVMRNSLRKLYMRMGLVETGQEESYKRYEDAGQVEEILRLERHSGGASMDDGKGYSKSPDPVAGPGMRP